MGNIEELKAAFLNAVPTGRENAIDRYTLAERLGYGRSLRMMRKDLSDVRKQGAVICSRSDSKGGYFQPKDRDELVEYLESMKSRGLSCLKAISETVKMLKMSDREEYQQMSLDDYEKEVKRGI